jgi:hypothetical protein
VVCPERRIFRTAQCAFHSVQSYLKNDLFYHTPRLERIGVTNVLFFYETYHSLIPSFELKYLGWMLRLIGGLVASMTKIYK